MNNKTSILLFLFWFAGILQGGYAEENDLDKAFKAIQNNDITAVKELIKNREILDAREKYGTSLLHQAIIQDKSDIVKILLDAGADIEIRTQYGEESPLSLACRKGNHPIFSLLIQKGAVLSPPDRLMLAAAAGGNLEIVKFLVEKKLPLNVKNEYGTNPLNSALQSGNHRLVDYIYQHERSLGKEKSLIHSAAYRGDIHLVDFCLRLGNGIDFQDGNGWTPLHVAVFERNLDLVKFLLKRGASVDKLSSQNYERRNDHVLFCEQSPPLDFAILNNEIPIASVIIKKVGRKKFDRELIRLFYYSQIYGYQEMGKYLISQCLNLNICDENGWTVLHHAAHLHADGETIGLILKKGANFEAKTGKFFKDLYNREFPAGSTAEQIAQVVGNANLAKALNKLSIVAAEPKEYKLVLVGKDYQIDVCPDGSIWIVIPIGMLFFTEAVDQSWHSYSFVQNPKDATIYSSLYKDVNHFDNERAIVSGSISVNGKGVVKKTDDGGKNWRDVPYGGHEWIYDLFCNAKGEAWMGGSSGEIFFSADFGEHWHQKNSPFDSGTRLNSIFMIDTNSGIAGALGNALYVTSDNWHTFKKLPTPFDQWPSDSQGIDGRILQVACWKEYWLANQCGRIYYCCRDKMNWREFPERLLSFSVDPVTFRCFAVTSGLKIVELTGSGEEIQLSKIESYELQGQPISIKALNSYLYVLDENIHIYRINEKEFVNRPVMVKK